MCNIGPVFFVGFNNFVFKKMLSAACKYVTQSMDIRLS